MDQEYVDLLYCHRPDIETPIEETARPWPILSKRDACVHWDSPLNGCALNSSASSDENNAEYDFRVKFIRPKPGHPAAAQGTARVGQVARWHDTVRAGRR